MISSVVFVEADAFDVVPRSSLMAAITLVHLSWPATSAYLRIFLSGYLLRNHVEVHHVVTWRGLMTLAAGLRGG